jgi:hypothetical protein
MKKYVALFEEFVFEELTRKDMEMLIHDKTKISPEALASLSTDDLLDVYLDVKNDTFTVDKATAITDRYDPKQVQEIPQENEEDFVQDFDKFKNSDDAKYDKLNDEIIEYAANDISNYLQSELPNVLEYGFIKGNQLIMYAPVDAANNEMIRIVHLVTDALNKSKYKSDTQSVINARNKVVITINNKYAY